MGIDLAIGGESWSGWFFGRWGRAREWRLHSPHGANYTAGELAELRPALLDADYLRLQLRQLTDYTASDALHFGPCDARALIAVAEMILRATAKFSAHPGGNDGHRQRTATA